MTQRLDITSALVRSAVLVHEIYAAASHDHGLTPQQAKLLCVIQDRPSTMCQAGALLGIEKSSMTGLFARIERAGWVVRVKDPQDARAFRIELTPPGRTLAEGFRAAVTDEIAKVVSTLRTDERQALADLLSKVVLDHHARNT